MLAMAAVNGMITIYKTARAYCSLNSIIYKHSKKKLQWMHNPQALTSSSWWMTVAKIELRADRLFLRECNESSVIKGNHAGLVKLTQGLFDADTPTTKPQGTPALMSSETPS